MAGEPAQYPLPDLRLYPLDIGVGERGLPEIDCLFAVWAGLDDAVNHHAVKMHRLVEGRADAQNSPPPVAHRLRNRVPARAAPLDHAQEDRQHRRDRATVLPQEVP